MLVTEDDEQQHQAHLQPVWSSVGYSHLNMHFKDYSTDITLL